uniref:ATP synthase F0 subunit 8 n=1 Tax=Nodularia douglasiae TaxID=1830228 RepID=A0A2K8C1J4_9BIVA|nr:ATP synthase F0 subunit 8 [Nodularia douglasiae]
MPQLSPVSWVSVFVFVIGMVANMAIPNWWCGADDYKVVQMKSSDLVSCSRMFFWGKNLSKV